MDKKSTLRRDRQVVRILAILKTLGEGGRPSVHQLATRFKTRRETIYRDLRTLEEIGYPIMGDNQGRLSRPRLAASRSHIPVAQFTPRETTALLWAIKQTGLKQPFREVLETASEKLASVASVRNDFLVVGFEDAVGSQTRGLKNYDAHQSTILQLVEAIVRHQRCLVEYQSPANRKPRSFCYEPYRLLTVHGGLYCLGQVPPHKNLTTLAVDRIRSLEIKNQCFTVDPDFDPQRYEEESFGVVWETPMTVVIRFRKDQAPYVMEREWHPTQRVRTLENGCIELTFHAGGTFEIVRWILGWGDAAEVLQPRTLRTLVGECLRLAAKIYSLED